jgi:hypothetical protein
MITEILLELSYEERKKLIAEYQKLSSIINNKDTETLEESMEKGLSKLSAMFHKILLNVIYIHS